MYIRLIQLRRRLGQDRVAAADGQGSCLDLDQTFVRRLHRLIGMEFLAQLVQVDHHEGDDGDHAQDGNAHHQAQLLLQG